MHRLFELAYRNDRGATSIEYALVAGMIAMVIISSITLLGPQVQAMFEDLAAAFATIG
jgi:pilus assembly protein Flp/PilA